MLFAFFNQNLAVVILNLRDNRSRDCTYITIGVPMITQSQYLLLLVYFILWHFSLNIVHNSPSTDEPLINRNPFEMAFKLPFQDFICHAQSMRTNYPPGLMNRSMPSIPNNHPVFYFSIILCCFVDLMIRDLKFLSRVFLFRGLAFPYA